MLNFHTFLYSTVIFGFLSSHAALSSPTNVAKKVKIAKRSELELTNTDADKYNAAKFAVLNAKRRTLILDIKKFIREARDTEQKSELQIRLASLYMEEYHSELAKAQDVYQKEIDKYDALPRKVKRKAARPRLDQATALSSLKKARSLYKKLLKVKAVRHRHDEVHFYLASSSLDLGRTKEAMRHFGALTSKFPRSKYLPEALVQLGDYYFEKASWAKAKSQYTKLIKTRTVSLLPYAKYKNAWCSYNLGDHKRSLKDFKWVIRHEGNSTQSGYLRIRQEAVRDIALPYAELKILKPAMRFYQSVGTEAQRRGYRTMAELYAEKGHHKHALHLWRALLQLDANHKSNPDYDLFIVESLILSNKTRAASKHLFEALPKYMKGSSWYDMNSSRPAAISEAVNKFEAKARKMALDIHARAQKTKEKYFYRAAKELYTAYLEHFGNRKEATKIRFYLAEILFKDKVYAKAAHHYFLVYKDKQAGKLRKPSIKYALTALAKEVNIERKKAGLREISSSSDSKLKAKSDEQLEAIPYSQTEEKFIKVSKVYLKEYPKSKEAPEILYEHAYLQYVHHELDSSYDNFWAFIKNYPKHSAATNASQLILDILNRRKNYDKLIAATKQFLNAKNLGTKQFRGELAKVLRQAELKRVQLVESKGEFKNAAMGYLDYTKEYGSQDRALFEKALYNATINFDKANMLLHAVETRERFLRTFPKSKYTKEMLLMVAKTYEKLARFDKAAYYYHKFASRFPGDKRTATAWRLSGLYYWAAGKADKAEVLMRQFVSGHGGTSAGNLVEQDLLDLYKSQDKTARIVQLLDRQRTRKGVPWSRYLDLSVQIAELQAETSPKRATATARKALEIARQNNSIIRKSARGREAMGKLMFWAVTRDDEVFRKIRLALPQSRLQANLKKKLALLQNLEKRYQEVAGVGSGNWGTAAMFRISEAYRHMAEAVQHAPVPTELAAADLEKYREEVKKTLVTPFNEKALAFSVQCLDKSQELNLLSPWTAHCHSTAAALQPERYPNVRTFYLPPLMTRLVMPSKEDKIAKGKVRRYMIPVFSSGIFQPSALNRSLASTETASFFVKRELESSRSTPRGMTYQLLKKLRLKAIVGDLKSSAPKPNKAPSFAFLNLKRVANPKEALTLIRKALEKSPDSFALHNLLALSYLELKNTSAAKIIWLSLKARGFEHPSIENNLGVVAMLEGDEDTAISLFQEAMRGKGAHESATNLGFIALKYRNGFEAKKHFARSMDLGSRRPVNKMGMAVAQLQNRELDAATDDLPDLAKRYDNNPYARLSLAYALVDVAGEGRIAQKAILDYMKSYRAERDALFRRALLAAKKSGGKRTQALDNSVEDED